MIHAAPPAPSQKILAQPQAVKNAAGDLSTAEKMGEIATGSPQTSGATSTDIRLMIALKTKLEKRKTVVFRRSRRLPEPSLVAI